MNARPQSASVYRVCDELLLQPGLRLRIGEHVVDVGALRVVTRPDCPRLTSKAMAVLIELARHAGNTVTRDQLLDRVWQGRVITPDVLTQAIKELRRAFADDEKPSRYFETIPKVGYRLLASVSGFAGDDGSIFASPMDMIDPERNAGDDNDENGRAVAVPRVGSLLPLPAIVGICAALLIGFGALLLGSHWRVDSRASGWKVVDLRAITSDPGAESRPHVSPDGTRLAYVKADPGAKFDRIHVRALEQSAISYLTAQTDAADELPTWSPDGTQIAFERLDYDSCKLFVASSAGGGEREIGACQGVATTIFDWAPDGRSLITAESTAPTGTDSAGGLALERLDVASGARDPVRYDRGIHDQDIEAKYSPDGKWIAFRRGVSPYSNLCVMPASGGAVRQLTQISARIRGYTWTRDSSALVFSSNLRGASELFVIDLALGEPHPLGVTPAEYPDAARANDSIVYEIPRSTQQLAQVTIGGNGTPVLLAASTGSDAAPVLSPDGKQIAFASDRSGSQQLWLYDIATAKASALTSFRESVLLNPQWSGDAKQIVVTVRHADRSDLIEIDIATRRQRTIGKPQEHVLSGSYGIEPGSYLMMTGPSSPSDRLVYLREHASAGAMMTTLAEGVAHAELDRDAHRVYYTKTAQPGLFRRDLDGASEEEFVTPRVSSIQVDGWRVVRGKIWYVGAYEFNPTPIREFDPVSGEERTIGEFKVALNDMNFSVDAAHDRIIMSPIGVEDTDVGAFRLVSSAAK